jgi:hypothetical protein
MNADQRRQWRLRRREERWGGAPIGAIILLILGFVLLAQNFGVLVLPERWWAFFLLIPAAGSLVAAVRNYRGAGDRVTGEVIGSLISTVIFVTLWAAFFFEFGWGMFWPVLLIAIGAALLVRDYWPRSE